MITRLEIEGFRSFREVAVDLAPFTVLVGQNGSGKSNLLEAVDLAAQVLTDSRHLDVEQGPPGHHTWRGGLRPGGDRRGRILDLFHRYGDGSVADRLRLTVCFLHVDPEYGLLHLRLDAEVNRPQERGSPSLTVSVRPLTEAPAYWGLDSRLQEEIRANAEVPYSLVEVWRACAWDRLVPRPSAARKAPDLADDTRVAPDAGNLAAVLGRLLAGGEQDADEEHARRALLLRADTSAVLPGLVELLPRPNEHDGTWELDLVYRDGTPIPVRLASDGTLHALALLTAAHDGVSGPLREGRAAHRPGACATLMIEDVENGLHPGQVRELVDRLRRCSGVDALQQIIVTTHSPVVLSAVYPEHTGDIRFVDTVVRVGGGEVASRHTRVRPLAESGRRGTFVGPYEVRRYLESATAGSL
ncbi:AAA family ATPase [Streptomyces sp. SCSIO ZS0520]|uniref:AAA family ATPase n=1 Tax=Streptomyces sp. SCSIO ZS0520 TaxID=2892996 RepID=UPI0021D96D44|nr:ATP-binding protein [Streptomyces sp. SCSIO ZS0520]